MPRKDDNIFQSIQFLVSLPTIVALSVVHIFLQQPPDFGKPFFILLKDTIPSIIAVLVGFMVYYWCFITMGSGLTF
jgi:hypothetical protein